MYEYVMTYVHILRHVCMCMYVYIYIYIFRYLYTYVYIHDDFGSAFEIRKMTILTTNLFTYTNGQLFLKK